MYFTNAWNTAYLPINSNHIYDHKGSCMQDKLIQSFD